LSARRPITGWRGWALPGATPKGACAPSHGRERRRVTSGRSVSCGPIRRTGAGRPAWPFAPGGACARRISRRIPRSRPGGRRPCGGAIDRALRCRSRMKATRCSASLRFIPWSRTPSRQRRCACWRSWPRILRLASPCSAAGSNARRPKTRSGNPRRGSDWCSTTCPRSFSGKIARASISGAIVFLPATRV
jgi:hypothetical protein